LQVSISKLDDDDNENDTSRISVWCRALQQVAVQVAKALDLPPNLLLDTNTNPTTSLDLMRVFYYHAVDVVDNNTNGNAVDNQEKVLGSSPHTDWGSFTVVWQDDVGGLQTYCHACQTYGDVAPSKTPTKEEVTNHIWNCIVHVGDVTSLALAAAAAAAAVSDSEDASSHHEIQQWPSPKHRVVSQNRLRTSLVYFGYPPPHLSLEDVTCALAKWAPKSHSCSKRSSLPLDEYYLLKNQSTESNVTAATVLQSIQNQPLGKVFSQKWKQVQR
jgi:hypothetical protein